MMINFRNFTQGVYLFVISVIIISCEEEGVITTRDFPRITIDENIEQDANGVAFTAKIISEGISDVTSKGFVWAGSDPKLRIYKSWVYLDMDADFNTTVQWDLIENREYTVRAFAQNKEYITFSQPIDFVSEYYCPSPEIFDFNPKMAKWGENIVIEGNFFSYSKKYINVSLGNIVANVDSCTNNKIIFTVPPEINNNSVKINIEVYSGQASTDSDFTYIYPKFIDYYPKSAANIDTLYISGNDFHLNKDHYKVTVGGIQASVLFLTDKEIKIIVPYNLKDVSSEIKINTMGVTHTFEKRFTLIQ